MPNGSSTDQASIFFRRINSVGGDPLTAASIGHNPWVATLSAAQANALLPEAFARWQAAGVDTSALAGIDIRIADLGGATLGLADEVHHTIWVDDNAAGWGWFVDPTPWDDSEFTTPGNQGEQNRMDLLTVLDHELGHLLGFAHATTGVMEESVTPGTRRMPAPGLPADPAAHVLSLAMTWTPAWGDSSATDLFVALGDRKFIWAKRRL
jgi:hypothetical protein